MRGKPVQVCILLLFILLLVNCGKPADSSEAVSENNADISQKSSSSPEDNKYSDKKSEKKEIFGVWKLDKVVLKSDMVDGTSKEALVIDEEDYLGYEVEYTSEFFRLGQDKYPNPIYNIEYRTASSYNDGGRYKLPDFFGFINDSDIVVDGKSEYGQYWSELPLKVYDITFTEEHFIPVGTQIVVLNDDTILVGIWGKIILAHRVNE